MTLFNIVIGILASLILFYILKNILHMASIIYYAQKLPGPPKENIFFGNLRPLHDTPDKIFKVFRNWGLQYLPIYKIWFFFVSAVVVINPEDMALILSNIKHSKKGRAYVIVHRWLGMGLLTSYGTKWQVRRKILTPTFHFSILQDFISVFNECTEELVEAMKKEIDRPSIEINPLITNFTLKVIGETAMGIKMDFTIKKANDYKKAFEEFIPIFIHRSLHPYLYYNCFYFFDKMKYKEVKIVKILHEFTKDVITRKRNEFYSKNITAHKRKRLAMLDLLLTVQKEEGIIDDEGIREEVDTFIFEGHDTVSAAINFTLMMIANHPQVQDKIIQEMHDVLGDIKKKPLYADLQNLRYMERCIKEVLRLYPSVPIISRELGEDVTTHNGYKLKKGTMVLLHIFSLHRNPAVYSDPEKFDPDRFLPEKCDKRHPYAYVPFSAGPRNCIGQKFAMLEMKTVLCGILSNFILEPVDTPQSIVFVVDLVLRTKDSIKVRFVPRDVM